jgi:ABC-type branched-subunit amino acid transport system ATPase component
MLGLSKALILRPQLLLIDELSLGLAPVIVGQLLEMVRAINAEGTAVVLVEQSVNIALNLVDHAYFMEKGEIRFDGRAQDLLARGDLLRAVFLEGVDADSTKSTRARR